jgi:hypothetical protein
MKRLRDEPAADPTCARGRRLLCSGSPSPRRPSPEMKRRVWARLVEARTTTASARTTTRAVVTRRSAILMLLLVLSTATAGAVIGQRVMSRGHTSLANNDHLAVVARPAGHQRSHTQPQAVDDVLFPPTNNLSADVAVPIEPHRRVAVHSSRGTDRSAPDKSVARSVVDQKEQAGHQLVVDAMLALRRTQDFRRAGALLEDYLTKYPRGALREEAIALAVEAAAARADLARSDYWASLYLKSYPAGRFRGFVEASRGDRK